MAESIQSDGVKHQIKESVEHVTEKIREMKSDLRDRAGEVLGSLREAGSHASQAVRDNLGRIRTKAADCCTHGREKVQAAEKSLTEKIVSRPLASVAIAAGIGFVIGMIWKRRR